MPVLGCRTDRESRYLLLLRWRLQQVARVPLVGLLPARDRDPRTAQQQLLAQLTRQALKPTEVPSRFHGHAHPRPSQTAIELGGFFGVHQAPVSIFSA